MTITSLLKSSTGGTAALDGGLARPARRHNSLKTHGLNNDSVKAGPLVYATCRVFQTTIGQHMRRCPTCLALNPSGHLSCSECGASLATCGHCGFGIEPHAQFCGGCGR